MPLDAPLTSNLAAGADIPTPTLDPLSKSIPVPKLVGDVQIAARFVIPDVDVIPAAESAEQ